MRQSAFLINGLSKCPLSAKSGHLKKYKNIILIVVLVGIAGVGYRVFFGVDGIDASLLISERTSSVPDDVGQDLLALLRTLRDIQLDNSIFSDPVFQSLEDLSQELVPEPVGRNNPFAPIGVENGI